MMTHGSETVRHTGKGFFFNEKNYKYKAVTDEMVLVLFEQCWENSLFIKGGFLRDLTFPGAGTGAETGHVGLTSWEQGRERKFRVSGTVKHGFQVAGT
jgi:hypothetical protein